MSTPTSALPDPHAYEERIRTAIDRIERIGREIDERHRSPDAEREERARRGDLGPQWQTMQRRIDAGETSLEAVFTGKDESPLAQAMLAASRKRLTEMAQTPEAERPESFTEALEELTATRAQVEGMQGTAGQPS